jgi:4-hydroxy 2-oxovalerate aldolase
MGLDHRVRCCPDGLMTDRRRDVKVLDCTIRDGGCCNGWWFEPSLVKDTFNALSGAGVDVMEIGYQTSPGVFKPGEVGPWRYCEEELIQEVAEDNKIKLATMLDYGRFDLKYLKPAKDSLISIIRLAAYGKDIDGAIEILEGAQALGYEVFCNVMAVSTCTPQEVDTFLERLRQSTVENVAVVDSFGAMYPHHIRYLIRKYKNWLRPDQKVGVHFHNNQQSAFANTIAAIDEGADFVDATVLGMGRGAGNCPLELLLMYLDNPNHDVHPILPLMSRFAELRDSLKWDYHPPYAISGWLNVHPKSAIDKMRSPEPYELLAYYDELIRIHKPRRHHRAAIE